MAASESGSGSHLECGHTPTGERRVGGPPVWPLVLHSTGGRPVSRGVDRRSHDIEANEALIRSLHHISLSTNLRFITAIGLVLI